MKKHILTVLSSFFTLMYLSGCQGFSEASSTEDIQPLTVSVNMDINVENLDSVKDLKIKLNNYSTGVQYERQLTEVGTVSVDNIIPGIYTISISGNAYDTNGNEYYVNGNLVNKAIYKGLDAVNISISGLKVSPLVFTEIYYAGSPKNYFRDQFYEVYNNSSEVQYLDGLYFAQLYPLTATRTLPVWNYDDGGKMCYGDRIWKFPGSGHDYPLQPGESAVLSQLAVNHQLSIYNPLSPVDGSHSEFEFNMDNPSFPDQPAIDMVHVYYKGKAEKGTLKQFLTSVFGSAFAIFKVPNGSDWNPLSIAWQNYEVGMASSPKAKIPNEWVLDAVECVNGESYADAKRIPGVLDAGVTWVGASYNGLGVSRKLVIQNGDTLRREDNTLIFQDTNNSTDDFLRQVVPVMHRYNTGVPSWNTTY